MNKKNTLKKLLVALVVSTCSSFSFGQVILTQDFEGAVEAATGLPAGWTETGLSTDGIFSVGTNTNVTTTAWPVPAHTKFAYTTDDICDCDKSEDRLILPAQNLSTYTGGLKLKFDALVAAAGETGTVEVSTDAGATWEVVHTIAPGGITWANNIVVTLNQYIGQSNVWISFKYNDNDDWWYGLLVDNVSLEVTPPVTNFGLAVRIGEYTQTPLTQMEDLPIVATVTNVGTTSATSVAITTRIYQGPNYTTPISTLTTTTGAIAVGGSATVNIGTYAPTGISDFVYQHSIAVAGDLITSNDTIINEVAAVQNEYSRDNLTPVSSLGLPPGNAGIIGITYDIVGPVTMDSVLIAMNAPANAAGNIIQFKISAVVAGVPSSTYIGQSAPHTLLASEVGAARLIRLPVTAIAGGPLELTTGDYFVGLDKTVAANQNWGILCTEDVYTPGTVFGKVGTGSFTALTNLVTGGFPYTPIIRPYINPICEMAATATTTESGCGLTDGTATVVATDGTAPYTYAWTGTTATTATATGLGQGVYEVEVTDFYGCKFIVEDITVTNPNSPVVALDGTVTNVTCNGLSNGSASVAVTGGTAPYTYTWGGSTSTTEDATDLSAGNHLVTVVDDANCSATLNVAVTAPAALASTVTFVAPSCNAGTNGTATVVPTGGTAPYTYAWTGTTSSAATATGLAAGAYSALITDANGCTRTQAVTVTQPNALTLTSTTTGASAAANGSVNLTVSGGTSPYTYAWSNSTTTQDLTNVAAGTYTVTVTDANGCTQTASATVANTASINEIEGSEIAIFPNPSNGNFSISVEGITTGKISVEVLDLAGKVVYTNSMNVNASKTIVPMNLSGVSAGNYIVKLNTEAGSAISRIIIE